MDVQVVHRLPSVGAGIDHRAVAPGDAFGRGDLRGGEHDLSYQRWIAGLVERRDVYTGDDENVRRRLRVDVAEGDGMLVLPYDPGGNLAANNPAEEAGIGHVVLSNARVRARAAMAAVSKRRTLVPSEAPRQPASSNASRSSGSKPPSGPSASTTGAWAVARMSGMGRPRSSSAIAPPVATGGMATVASHSGRISGSQASP